MSYTLADIKTKIRSVTGRTLTDVSDSDLEARINNFYIYTMPNEIKLKISLQPYSFQTVAGQDVYPFPSSTFYTLRPDAWCDGHRMAWYEDKNLFLTDFPNQVEEDSLATGDAILVNFTGTIQSYPIVTGSMLVFDGVETFTDNGNGTLTGSETGSGTIDYDTGDYNITFNAAPADGAEIKAKYQPYTSNMPYGLLIFNNEITIRDISNSVYNIEIQGYALPAALTVDSQTAIEAQLGPLLVYGTSIEIFAENGDLELYNYYLPIYQRYESVALDRTAEFLSYSRSIPNF